MTDGPPAETNETRADETPTDDRERAATDGRPPSRFTGLEVSARATQAGGLTAVRSAYRHMKDAGYGPVEATRVLRSMNQVDGFDCPGCAWPDPDDRRSMVAEYCENGAKAFAEEATRARADAAFWADHSIAALRERSDFELSRAGRLTEPLVRHAGDTHYRPITWEDALDLVAERLARTAATSPDRAAFYTSGRTSNEAAFLYQLLVRRFGTNNLPDCSNMCHESSGVGLGATVGIGKGSVTLSDVEGAELILVIGQNPGTNHPRMLTALQAAKRRGAVIVAINPLPEAGLMHFRHPQEVRGVLGGGTQLADIWLPVRIGGDIPLLKGIMQQLDAMEQAAPGTVFDQRFIDDRTDGVDAFLADLRQHDLADLEAECGVDAAAMRQVADLIAARDRIVACWAMGLTQHRHGVANVQEIVNLLLLRGAIGRAGAGTCPVRGHSNVQGDRTMGIVERPTEAFSDAIQRTFGFDPPRTPGYATVDAIAAMERGDVDVFVALGGNFLSAAPDTDRVAAGLQRCDLTVHLATKPNRTHLVPGTTSLLLPVRGRTERDPQAAGDQFVTVENSMGVVHRSAGTRPPASDDLRSEPWIVAHLAAAMERRGAMPTLDSIDWTSLADDYRGIRTLIERTIPGFEDFERRVAQPGGFLLPNPARDGSFDPLGGRARFTVNERPRIDEPAGSLRMMTIRSHDQFNTTIYGLDDRYRGVRGERRVIFMHRADMADRALAAGDVVDLCAARSDRRVDAFIVVPYEIPRGCCATYFPEANPLVALEDHADRSHTPASKLVSIVVVPSRGGGGDGEAGRHGDGGGVDAGGGASERA